MAAVVHPRDVDTPGAVRVPLVDRPSVTSRALCACIPEPSEGTPLPILSHLCSTHERRVAPHAVYTGYRCTPTGVGDVTACGATCARRRHKRSSDVGSHVVCGRLLLARGTDAHLPTPGRGLHQDCWRVEAVLADMPDQQRASALRHALVERGRQGLAEGRHHRGWTPTRGHAGMGHQVGLNIAKVSYGARAALASGFVLHREV